MTLSKALSSAPGLSSASTSRAMSMNRLNCSGLSGGSFGLRGMLALFAEARASAPAVDQSHLIRRSLMDGSNNFKVMGVFGDIPALLKKRTGIDAQLAVNFRLSDVICIRCLSNELVLCYVEPFSFFLKQNINPRQQRLHAQSVGHIST